MFLVFNKEKIVAYIVSILAVTFLFVMANIVTTNRTDIIATSSNAEKLLPIYNVQTQENKVALTMNCAWNANDIDSILETLKNNNVNITFFMVGDWIEKYPEYAKKIYESGNEIGSHSNTHPHVNNLSKEKNIEELRKCNEKIEKITGSKANLYRTPYGEYNNTVLQAAKEEGYRTIQWNIDTLDYNSLTGEEMWSRINNKLEKGSIILTHNGTTHTADSLDMIIKNIKKKGFEIVKVSELIYQDNYNINNNGTQIKK